MLRGKIRSIKLGSSLSPVISQAGNITTQRFYRPVVPVTINLSTQSATPFAYMAHVGTDLKFNTAIFSIALSFIDRYTGAKYIYEGRLILPDSFVAHIALLPNGADTNDSTGSHAINEC